MEHDYHASPNLFRDGGNSPAIWATADLTDTGLRLAKDFLRERGYVKNDLDVTRRADSSYLDEALAGQPATLNTERCLHHPSPVARRCIAVLGDVAWVSRQTSLLLPAPTPGSSNC